ncbi:polyprenyl synthetase family protein [Oxalobacteraceae bacterium OTU3CINTB1]|nr:polyprenyl synthetase family protein [Oxalobacteraceae bacterium OTU3CINTB1]
MSTKTLTLGSVDIKQCHDSLASDMEDVRRHIEERLSHALPDQGRSDPLTGAMRAATLGTGKRMRPLLLMAVARDLGCTSPALLDAACAVELVHAASLILDDLPCMDDAKLRRGMPTVHRQFGEHVAILASVALLSRAFQLLSQASGIPAHVRTRLVGALADTVGAQGLVRGQFLDLHGNPHRSLDDIARTNELKTGVLLGLSVEMAAIIAEADERVMLALRSFALSAGQAFQIKDDLLDDADATITGKDAGQDAGKATFNATLGRQRTAGRLADHLREADIHLSDAIGGKQGTRSLVGTLFRNASPLAAARAS